ncbi:hypothetical protein [Castellaniella caeni]|nr:hypothetical protein [Castellaniella caeni]
MLATSGNGARGSVMTPSLDPFKRVMLLLIIVLSLLSTVAG